MASVNNQQFHFLSCLVDFHEQYIKIEKKIPGDLLKPSGTKNHRLWKKGTPREKYRYRLVLSPKD